MKPVKPKRNYVVSRIYDRLEQTPQAAMLRETAAKEMLKLRGVTVAPGELEHYRWHETADTFLKGQEFNPVDAFRVSILDKNHQTKMVGIKLIKVYNGHSWLRWSAKLPAPITGVI